MPLIIWVAATTSTRPDASRGKASGPAPSSVKPPSGTADHAHADHRTVEMPREARDRRIGLAAPAEKRDVDAAGEMLIRQHPDMLPGGQSGGHLDRRLIAGADQLAHRRGPDPLDLPRHDRIVRHAINDGRIHRHTRAAPAPRVPSSPRCAEKHNAGLPSVSRSMNSAHVVGLDASLDAGCDGSKSQSLSRCTYSPATRPRLSHSALSVASCQAASFSGNAARMLARPTRCTGSSGPIARATAAHNAGARSRAEAAHQREQREHDAADDPIAQANQCTEETFHAMRSEFHEDLSEHVPMLQPRHAGAEIVERIDRVDHRTSRPLAMRSSARPSAEIGEPNEPMIRYCC